MKVPVIDDSDWNPDLDFYVELFNIETEESLGGVDTRCQVTILDEDFPGVIGFQDTEVRIGVNSKEVTITIERFDGSAGEITCSIQTEMLAHDSSSKAHEYEHYLPLHDTITFASGEKEATIKIDLLPEGSKVKEIPMTEKGKDVEEDEDKEEGEESDDEPDLIFKIKIDKPKPEGVKVSRKNVCFVTIVRSDEFEKQEEERQKLIAFYLAQQNPDWAS